MIGGFVEARLRCSERDQKRGDVTKAGKAVATAHHRAGTAAETVEIDGRDGARERVAQLAARDPLAMAHDAAVVGIS